MALSYVTYTANGSTNQFAISFDYIEQAHVKVYINNVEDTNFTFVNASLIQTSSTPSNGAVVKIDRDTPTSARLVDFADGSVISEVDLDKSANQNFFIAQETTDTVADKLGKDASGLYDAGNIRIINVANPTADQDAVTKYYLENTWLSTTDKTNLTTVAGQSTELGRLGTADAVADMNTLGTADVVNDLNILGNATTVTNMNLLGTADVVADMNLLGTSSVVADMDALADKVTEIGRLGTADAVADMVILGTADVVADMNTLATADVVADLNTLGTADVVSDMNTLATADVVSDMNTLATAQNVTNMNTLAGISGAITGVNNISSDVSAVNSNASNINAVNSNSSNINAVAGKITEIGRLGTADAVADMSILGTADVVADMNTLATADVVADMNTLANSDIITDLNTLATSDIVTDMNLLATSDNVNNMATLGASGVVGNISTVANSISNVNSVGGAIANVNTVASNLASVSNFGNVYRVSNSAPSTSLDSGDLWFDSTNDILKVYGGSGWQNAGSSINGTSQRFKFIATNNQTTFSGNDSGGVSLNYDVGYIDVYLNGVHLDPTDYTASDGSSIVLGSGANTGDILYVVGFGTFSVANMNASNLTSGTVPIARLGTSGTKDSTTFLRGDNTFAVVDTTNASNLSTGTLPNARLSSVPNSALANNSITINGSSVALGGSVTVEQDFSWETKTSDFNVSARRGYFVDTSSGVVTATLPASPSAGDDVRFIDVSATFDTNNLTIARNGKKIQGATSDLTVATERAGLGLVFSGDTNGWLLIEK